MLKHACAVGGKERWGLKKEKMTMLEVSPWCQYVPSLSASNVFLCILRWTAPASSLLEAWIGANKCQQIVVGVSTTGDEDINGGRIVQLESKP
jgi:hypothetical protein